MATMRAVQISRPGGPLEIVERPIPDPSPGTVRIRVHACGICHSDAIVLGGQFPGLTLPRVPGHEVAGVIDAVGAGVTTFEEGQSVGVGWHGGYCAHCDPCRRGELFACTTGSVSGISFDGGYADYMVAPASAVAHMPAGIAPIDAAPLLCAGVTTFNCLRNCGAQPGDLVAIHGLGGLGHLAVQYAAKMGFRTVAVARGQDKASFAKELGASIYLDSEAVDAAAEMQKLGGAKAILATVTNGDAMSAIQGGLAVNGTMFVIGAAEAMTVSPLFLLSGRRAVKGWYSGTAIDSQDTLAFSVAQGVTSRNEVFPLDKAPEAFDRMMSGKARFRVVLSMT